MPTQSDVARKAGVSFITVSRVINNRDNVKEETRQKVLDAIKELKYYPNSLGRALNSNQVHTIGIMVPLMSGVAVHETAYFNQILVGIEHVCEKEKFDMLIPTLRGEGHDYDYLRLYYERKVDGLILLIPDMKHPQIQTAIEESIPCVVVGEESPSSRLAFVDSDNLNAIRVIVRQLLDKGHTRIGFLKGMEGTRNAEDRYQGYLSALKEAGITPNERWILPGDFGPLGGVNGAKAWSLMKDRPTAMVCSNDQSAIGFVDEIIRLGYRVPEDISVTGFDGIDAAQLHRPPIDTMVQPLREMGTLAAEFLFQKLNQPEIEIPGKILPVAYRPGGSIGAPRS